MCVAVAVSPGMQMVPSGVQETGAVAHVRDGVAWLRLWAWQGKLYTWGDGSNGRLGHGSDSVEWTPRLLLAVDQVATVSCGARCV